MGLHLYMFYACVVSLALAVLIGIAGIWVPGSWRTNAGWKLWMTSWILFVGTGVATLLTKWLQ